MKRYRVTISAVVRTYSAIVINAESPEEARRRALRIRHGRGEVDETKGEDLGDWCDSSEPSRFRVERIDTLTTPEGE